MTKTNNTSGLKSINCSFEDVDKDLDKILQLQPLAGIVGGALQGVRVLLGSIESNPASTEESKVAANMYVSLVLADFAKMFLLRAQKMPGYEKVKQDLKSSPESDDIMQ